MSLYGPIQVVPPGLLGFLQLKSAGKNPAWLSSDISPVFDLLKFYLAPNAENVVGVTGNIATGSTGFIQPTNQAAFIVPAEEWWYVHTFSMRTSVAFAAAGDAAYFKPAVVSDIFSAVGTARPLPCNTMDAMMGKQLGTLAGGIVSNAAYCDFLAGPGTAFGALLEIVVLAAGNINLEMTIRLTRLPS